MDIFASFVERPHGQHLGVIALVLAVIYIATHVSRWSENIQWLLTGPQLLARKYASGIPFTIQTPERQYIVVSSEAHVKELSQAKEDQLSLVATAEEVFQPVYTMNGVELNRLGLQNRILRSLTLNLSSYQDPLTELVQTVLAGSLEGRKLDDGWASMSIFNLAQNAVGKANIYTFYSEEFTHDNAFLEAALQYPVDVFIAAEALRCVPNFLAPLVAWLVTRGHRSSTQLISKLLPMIEDRLKHQEPGITVPPHDYIQYIVNLYPGDTPDKAEQMVKQTLALWFASVHQPAMTLFYALVDLCSHPEYLDSLFEEVKTNKSAHGYLNVNELPLLDSFLRESARMNASESISLRRKAMEPYHFKDGTHIPLGNWACVPQREIMRDPSIYPHPDVFDAYRFVKRQDTDAHSTEPANFTDTRTSYTFWGLGRQACPGRFYTSFILKIIIAEILQNFDIKLKDISAQRTFTWRSSIVPFPTAEFSIRPKQHSC